MRIALCIPHLPGIPKRDASFADVTDALGIVLHEEDCGGRPLGHGMCAFDDSPDHLLFLTDREPNWSWAAKMRAWFLSTDADLFLTLQDDVIVSPRFWDELRAMAPHVPKGAALGLSSVHPMQTEIARQGLRWYQTRAWLVGWAWAMWREDMVVYDAWCRGNEERVRATNEDSMLNEWLIESGRSVWHPVPAIVDHDTSIESTYANDAHVHRRPLVTWRDVQADLTRTEYWLPSGKEPPLLSMPSPRHCWFCGKRPPVGRSPNGACICGVCVLEIVASGLGMRLGGG